LTIYICNIRGWEKGSEKGLCRGYKGFIYSAVCGRSGVIQVAFDAPSLCGPIGVACVVRGSWSVALGVGLDVRVRANNQG
jgi:hypothetical protein